MIEFPLPEAALEPFYNSNGSLLITESMLNRFLVNTSSLQLDSSERLRFLAINIEHQQFKDGWFSLKRIYTRSINENPQNINSYHSLVVSAIDWLNPRQTEVFQDRMRIASLAEECMRQAILLAPDDAELLYLYGKVLYEHPERIELKKLEYIDMALDQFELALSKDSDHQMSALYKAHCLHDQERWREADYAYTAVDVEALLERDPHSKWRVLKLKEQRALCCAKMGDFQTSVLLLLDFILEVEKLSDKDIEYDVFNLHESVNVLTHIIKDQPDMLRRLRQIACRIGMDDYYQWSLDIEHKTI